MKRRLSKSAALGLLLLTAPDLRAQSDDHDPSIANLPRPGYEPLTIHSGSFVIAPSISANTTYDDNILATPTDRIGDAIFTVSPRVTIDSTRSNTLLHFDAHGDIIRYASHPREDVNAFGAALNAAQAIGSMQTITAKLSFDRTFERRSDPEADLDRTLPPALINLTTGELEYRYQGTRIEIVADASISQLNYLPAFDDDRDMTTYRGSVQALLDLSKGIGVYVQPYVNRRQFRLSRSSTGIFGDATTVGALAGVHLDIGDLLQGNLGVGVFSASPDGAPSFTGVAINGRLVWRPRVRTSIVLSALRGDVATARAGSIGRLDTNVSLAIDQEVRHNLLLHFSGGVLAVHYRAGLDNDQTYYTGNGEATYLLNRHVSLLASANYTHRTSPAEDNRFERIRLMLGARFVY